MKRMLAVVLIVGLLAGCSAGKSEIDRAMALRQKLLEGSGCSFDAVITADYGDKIYTFRMDCQGDKEGNLAFTVTEPDTISGITGNISHEKGALTFDDKVLAFELLSEGQVTPVSAPWLIINTLRSGYLSACGTDGENLRIAIDDSYEEDALHLDIWLDSADLPIRAEILWQGRRIVSADIRNFTIL